MLTSLEGFAVGVTADRRADEQADLFHRRGARVFHGPVIRTVALGSDDALRHATRTVLDHPPDYFVANTGIGVRGWFTAAESWGWDDDLTRVLEQARILARGPKAAGALHSVGLDAWWRAPGASLAEVTGRLLAEPLAGRKVAFQLDGGAAPVGGDAIRAAGAELIELPVYRWVLPERRDAPNALIDRVCRGDVDALTFTSAPAIVNLLELARDRGREQALRTALNDRVVTVVIGPHCAEVGRDLGLEDLVEPRATRLGSMVRVLTERLGRQRVDLRTGDARVVVQGRAVVIRRDDARDRHVWLPSRERWILGRLLERRGAVVGRADLTRVGWQAAGGDHVLDVTIARLRRRLGRAGALVETVPKRGYRISAEIA